MPKTREKYIVGEVDLYHVRNRNEQRVVQHLSKLIEERGLSLDADAIRDAYAYALNRLPARYTQQGTIVLREPVRKGSIEEAVEAALEKVTEQP